MISLLEFLQSADKDKFASFLEKTYEGYIISVTKVSENPECYDWGSETLVVALKSEDYDALMNDTDFFNTCYKMQWIPSWVKYSRKDDEDIMLIFLEPIAKNGKHVDTCYHLTSHETYEKFIKKNGLKVRGHLHKKWAKMELKALHNDSIHKIDVANVDKSLQGYRSITPRIYVIGNRDIYGNLEEFYNQAYAPKSPDDYCVALKIDLSEHPNISIYRDQANPDDSEAYYLLENVPASLITIDEEMTNFLKGL